MTAAEAAAAIADGWWSVAPGDDLACCRCPTAAPASSTSCMQHSVVGRPCATTGPLGEPVTADLLLADGTAYVETAQACGLHLLRPTDGIRRSRRPWRRRPVAAAADHGAVRVVVGLGGSGTNDGGAGMWAGLGAEPAEVLSAGGLRRGLVSVTPPSGR